MLDSVFVNKSTGEQVKILNDDRDFFVLDNSVRIKKDVFYKKFEERQEVDPNSFFKVNSSRDPLLDIANQIKGIDSSKIPDSGPGTKVKYTPPVVISDNSMSEKPKQPQTEEPIHLSPEDKKKMLDEWKKSQPGAQIQEIQEKDYDNRFTEADKPIVPVPKVDPIQMMFKMFKNNYPVKLNLEIEENIPNPTFIGMVQENVEADAVEYYSNLISDKLLKDPSKLKTEIYNQLKGIINKELGIEEKETEKPE